MQWQIYYSIDMKIKVFLFFLLIQQILLSQNKYISIKTNGNIYLGRLVNMEKNKIEIEEESSGKIISFNNKNIEEIKSNDQLFFNLILNKYKSSYKKINIIYDTIGYYKNLEKLKASGKKRIIKIYREKNIINPGLDYKIMIGGKVTYPLDLNVGYTIELYSHNEICIGLTNGDSKYDFTYSFNFDSTTNDIIFLKFIAIQGDPFQFVVVDNDLGEKEFSLKKTKFILYENDFLMNCKCLRNQKFDEPFKTQRDTIYYNSFYMESNYFNYQYKTYNKNINDIIGTYDRYWADSNNTIYLMSQIKIIREKPYYHGNYYEYYKNGIISRRVNYKNGRQVGSIEDFYKNGKLKAKYTPDTTGRNKIECYYDLNGKNLIYNGNGVIKELDSNTNYINYKIISNGFVKEKFTVRKIDTIYDAFIDHNNISLSERVLSIKNRKQILSKLGKISLSYDLSKKLNWLGKKSFYIETKLLIDKDGKISEIEFNNLNNEEIINELKPKLFALEKYINKPILDNGVELKYRIDVSINVEIPEAPSTTNTY